MATSLSPGSPTRMSSCDLAAWVEVGSGRLHSRRARVPQSEVLASHSSPLAHTLPSNLESYGTQGPRRRRATALCSVVKTVLHLTTGPPQSWAPGNTCGACHVQHRELGTATCVPCLEAG